MSGGKQRWAQPSQKRTIFIGWDPREAAAYAVARHSLERRTTQNYGVHGVVLDDLRARGLYTRPHEMRDGRAWCPISEADISTEFANSRFLVPHLAETGWALFMDCDVLIRADIHALFNQVDEDKAVMCVKHDYAPAESFKMDGQVQTKYSRKNWSSVCLWNCAHEANRALTLEMINTVPGRVLHGFSWLSDDLIGALDPKWNFLVGHTDESIDPAIVHFTSGGPWFDEYRDVPYADEWRAELANWAL